MVNLSEVDTESQIYSGALTFGLYIADNSEDPGNCTQQQMMNGASDRNHLSLQPLLLLLLYVTGVPSPFCLFLTKYSLSLQDLLILAAMNHTTSILNHLLKQELIYIRELITIIKYSTEGVYWVSVCKENNNVTILCAWWTLSVLIFFYFIFFDKWWLLKSMQDWSLCQ